MTASSVRLLTVATRHKGPGGRGDLGVLDRSCSRLGLELTILGLGTKWRGGGMALRLIDAALAGEVADRVTLVVDAWDVVLLARSGEILQKFESFETPLVFSAEKGCWPDEDLAFQYPEAGTIPCAAASERITRWRPPPPLTSPFRYLNAGAYIGYAGAIRDAIHELEPRDEDPSDQRLLTRYFLNHTDRVSLDYRASLFQSLFAVDAAEVALDPAKPRRVRNRQSGELPCVLHGNGPGMDTFERLVTELEPYWCDEDLDQDARGFP